MATITRHASRSWRRLRATYLSFTVAPSTGNVAMFISGFPNKSTGPQKYDQQIERIDAH
jgi:hypothetical protein